MYPDLQRWQWFTSGILLFVYKIAVFRIRIQLYPDLDPAKNLIPDPVSSYFLT